MLQRITRRQRAAIGAGSLALVATGLVASVNGSLAYFSDSQPSTLTGSVGSIKGAVSSTTLAFDNLLPGEVQTVGARQTNTGRNNQDVWVVFTNPDALHALNNLGTFGEFHVKANGEQKFDSANLNDNSGNGCGPLSPAGCWPLPQKLKLASNIGPGAVVDFSFSFGYASKLQTQSPSGGGVWNPYPLPVPNASGLPYSIVETQVGQQP